MQLRAFLTECGNVARYLARWTLMTVPLACAIGAAVALFLVSLEWATHIRLEHEWLLFLLPVAGAVIGIVYHRWGKGADRGNNLVIDEIHEPGGGVPSRMAPLVLVATVVTHLFGGSAGREGTAVQIGGSFASAFDRLILRRSRGLTAREFSNSLLTRAGAWCLPTSSERATLLQAGMAAGFGAVFGTPLAGIVFALEVLSVGELKHIALVPCAMAAFAGDWTVAALGVHHVTYPQLSLEAMGVGRMDRMMFAKVALASALFGLVSQLFAQGVHGLSALLRKTIATAWLRPVLGGAVVIALTFAVGSRDYLGLGVTAPSGGVSIVSAFAPGGAQPASWFYKLLFTVVTIGSGFKGGEVTPLFFIGATLGNTLAVLLQAPVALFAALGFIAVFAGATNTPLACTLMGLELFGADATAYMAVACFVAYLCSGRSGIYAAQRPRRSIIDSLLERNKKNPA